MPCVNSSLDAHARQERDAFVALHHLADRLDGRHLQVHVQRNLVALELADHHAAVGRDDVVRDERFHAQFGDGNLASRGEAVLGRHHEGQVIGENHLRDQALVFGIEGQDAQLQIAVDQFATESCSTGCAASAP